MENLTVGMLYRHFKGNLYKVIALGKNSETMEEMVVYQDVNSPDKIWIRPKDMFLEKVNLNGILKSRFELFQP